MLLYFQQWQQAFAAGLLGECAPQCWALNDVVNMDHKWPQWIDATNYEHKNRSRPILLAYCDSEKDQIFFWTFV